VTTDGGQWDGVDQQFTTGDPAHLSFDGTNSYVNITAATVDFGENFTVEAWVKLNSTTDTYCILTRNGDGAGSGDRLFFRIVGDQVELNYKIGGSYYQALSTNTLSAGSWYHVAAVRAGDASTVYLNGTATSAAGTTGDLNLDDYPIIIGARANSSTQRFNGYIDEVAIYNRVLDANEINAHYYRRKYANPQPGVSIGAQE
jgi:hypothetical protein